MPQGKIRIGTRGSPLALAQAEHAPGWSRRATGCPSRHRDHRHQDLGRSHPGPAPLGGRRQRPLHQGDRGGAADRSIDLAVHSMKDVATALPDRLFIADHAPARRSPRCVHQLQGRAARRDAPGAIVGTASLRRQARSSGSRPDLEVITFRGNVGTRLQKLEAGQADATISPRRIEAARTDGARDPIMSMDAMLPAVAQGALGPEIRAMTSGWRRSSRRSSIAPRRLR